MKGNIIDVWGKIGIDLMIFLSPLILICIVAMYVYSVIQDRRAKKRNDFIDEWLKNNKI